jgi:hypothetical protein
MYSAELKIGIGTIPRLQTHIDGIQKHAAFVLKRDKKCDSYYL